VNIVYQHESQEPYAYALTDTSVRLLLKLQRGTADEVHVQYGDRYEAAFDGTTTRMTYSGWDGTWDYFTARIEVPSRRLRYAFRITAADHTVWLGERGISDQPSRENVYQISYLCPRDLFQVPPWVNASVVYQIFPERFAKGNPALTPPGAVDWDSPPTPASAHGGDLPGITQKLDYLADLGVTVMYLTPVFKAASNHKYDTTDYFDIDPQFGTKEHLRELVSEAHKRGIRVLLDAVFNHTGEGFAPFQDVIRRGKSSPYWDWFFVEGDEVDLDAVNYETFANRIRTMPKVNMAHPEAEKYFLEVAAYWIREFDIDGWRLDVANEIDHVFWRKFRAVVKKVKPDALIVGEVWHNSLPWLRGDQFDGVMNYLFRQMALDFFVYRTSSVQMFAQQMVQQLHLYPDQAQRAMFNLLGSHDTERVLTLAEGQVHQVMQALVFQFTYPGMPMIYYGDEVGMEGGPDPDCRRGMQWNPAAQNQVLFKAVRQLARLKQSEPALHGVRTEILKAENGILHYRRISDDGGSTLDVAFTTGKQSLPPLRGKKALLTVNGPEGTPAARIWREKARKEM
jgi:cyclomaltodextrinase / maltogenic alpha-amylase / neopullulanase